MGKDEETEIAVMCHAAQAPALRVGIGYLFFIRCWMFDVHLSMMVGLAGLDSIGPVDLLYQDESCHVMRKGHRGEG